MGNYQERFSRNRTKLLEHFRQGFDAVGVSKVDVSGLRQGVREYAEDHGYFKLTPQEIDEIKNNDLFADNSAKRISRDWESKAVDEVVRNFREKVGKAG